MKKKITAFLISAALLLPEMSVFAIKYDEYMQGRREYMSASYKISPGLTYTETLTENEKYGYERAYIYEYTPDMGTKIIPSYGDYVYGTESLGTLTKRLEDEGIRVVGGINGDFYSTSTGVPIGAMIVDGEIISSDNDRTAMGFDENGNAFISKPNIKTTLFNEEEKIEIEHINKYPLEYCLYLLTDKFYPTTKTTKESAEIVLMPYSESVTYMSEDEIPSREEGEQSEENKEVNEDLNEDESEEQKEESVKKTVLIYAEEESVIPADESEEQPEETDENAKSEDESLTEETKEDEETEETEKEKLSYFAKEYTFADEKLKIGSEIKVVVTEIRNNSKNSKIPEGCFVLCAENEFQYDKIKNLTKGNELTLSVTADEEWYGAVCAIGNSGGLILKDGEYCDDVEIDHYPYAHPRTAAGITADGRVIFYCVDGRQNSSGGLRIDQLSHEMKELGCVIAMNLDGGGSTTAYAALPGEVFSNLKNSPSVSTERKTANSLLFVNTTEKTGNTANFTIFPESPYVLSGGSRYELSAPVATDENLFPVELSEEFEYEYYTLSDQTDSYIIDGNIFVSGEKSGLCNLYVKVKIGESQSDYEAGHVFVLESPEDFSLGEEEYEISPFDTLKLDFNPVYHTGKIFYTNDSVKWLLPDKAEPEEELSEETETENPDGNAETEKTEETKESDSENPESVDKENSEETEETGETEEAEEQETEYFPMTEEGILENDKLSLTSELELTPKVHGETLILKAKVGNIEKEIKLKIKKFPFNDSFEHWSAKSLFEINSYGLMKGEEVGGEFAFFPARNLTRAEFITVLARMLYPDIDEEHKAEETEILTDEISDEAQTEQNTNEEETSSVTEEMIEPTQPEANEETAAATETATETASEPEGDSSSEITEDENELVFADEEDIPEWSKKYFDALSESGLLELICDYDEENNAYIKASEKIKRRDVLILLGALSDDARADFVGTFTDTADLYFSSDIIFINNALAAGIFEGYEDGSLRTEGELTRAEAATVILRFINNTATE